MRRNYGIPNGIPNGDIPNDADTWKRNSSLYPLITVNQVQVYSKKIEETLVAANVKPTTLPNFSCLLCCDPEKL